MSLKAPVFGLALIAAVVGIFAVPAAAHETGFTCRASAVRVTTPAGTIEPVVANAANNPCADDTRQLAEASPDGVVLARVLSAQTDAQPGGSASNASVADAMIFPTGVGDIRATALRSDAAASCTHGSRFHPGSPAFSGSSSIATLTVGGVAITVTGQANQTVQVGLVTIVINEQIVEPNRITVRALRVTIGTAEVVLAESIADVSGPHPCA